MRGTAEVTRALWARKVCEPGDEEPAPATRVRAPVRQAYVSRLPVSSVQGPTAIVSPKANFSRDS